MSLLQTRLELARLARRVLCGAGELAKLLGQLRNLLVSLLDALGGLLVGLLDGVQLRGEL